MLRWEGKIMDTRTVVCTTVIIYWVRWYELKFTLFTFIGLE